MTEAEAIECYDRAGAVAGPFAGVRWPDVALTEENLARLAEGVLAARLDFGREAFGPDCDTDALGERIEEAWRRDARQVRFAPEGVYVRVRCSIRVRVLDEDGQEECAELLHLEAELCLSFSTRRHARPFVDLMGGRLTRSSDGASRAIDPFGLMVEPQLAVAWGLNGAEP